MVNEVDDIDELAGLLSADDAKTLARERRSRPSSARVEFQHRPDETSRLSGGDEMWAVYGGRSFVACEKAVEALPPGQYTINSSERLGIHWLKESINLDELLTLPDSKSLEVIKEIEHFWTLEEEFRKFGFLWKRGVLLWGPPGSGKTSTLQIISKNIVDDGGISVYITNPDLSAKGLKIMRQVEPNRPIVVMLEDIDAIIDEYGESDLLALMDGELQIDNVVFVATTNYPDRLDKRFVNRPSRFDIIKKIGMPSEDARRVYLSTKNPRLAGTSELNKWVAETKGFSIAHLKELIVSVEVLRKPLDTAIRRLRKMNEVLPKASSGNGLGFVKTYDEDEDE